MFEVECKYELGNFLAKKCYFIFEKKDDLIPYKKGFKGVNTKDTDYQSRYYTKLEL